MPLSPEKTSLTKELGSLLPGKVYDGVFVLTCFICPAALFTEDGV